MWSFQLFWVKTFTRVYRDSDQIIFEGETEQFVQTHISDCCEEVRIEDICGDLSDLEGSVILLAEESVSEGPQDNEWGGSQTWSFYKLVTMKGSVTIHWYGSNNGYYSEKVDLLFYLQKP